MRVNKVQPDHKDPESVVEQQRGIIQVIDGLIEFGDPIDPFDPANTGRAGSAAISHPGSTSNIHGSWVEIELTAEGRSTKTCNHNLYLEEDNTTYTLPVSGEPNVRWLVFGWLHDSTGTSGSTRLDLAVYFLGGTVATNSVALEFDVTLTAGAWTLGSNNPLLVTLFFTRASRM